MEQFNIDANALEVINKLENSGFEAYAVGGCIRDMLLDKKPHDWDICTNALPQQVIECFSGYSVIPTGIKHGTVSVLIGKQPFEITTYRIDGEYNDKRRPSEVHFVGEIKKDLSRRDFTINAMAYSPTRGFADFFGGKEDLDSKIIRAVGNPELRFKEDGLRIIRALRFSSLLGFQIEDETKAAIFNNRRLLENVSVERIASELCSLLCGINSEKVLLEYHDVLAVFIPEISVMVGFKQNNPWHMYDVWQHTAKSVGSGQSNKIVRLSLLFHDMGKPACYTADSSGVGHFYGHGEISSKLSSKILKRLHFDKETIVDVSALVEWHDAKISPNKLLKWMNRLGVKQLRRLFEVKKADILAQNPDYINKGLDEIKQLEERLEHLLKKQCCFSLKNLDIDGGDLLKLGYPKGKIVGDTLRILLDMHMDGKIDNLKELLIVEAEKLLELYKNNGQAKDNE